jgi:hypothetical protein
MRIAATEDQHLLVAVAAAIIAETESRIDSVTVVDRNLGYAQRAEAGRLRGLLERLIPELFEPAEASLTGAAVQ